MAKTIQQFLSIARQTVREGLKATAAQRILLVTGNESADLDSFTSSLIFAYLTATHPTPTFKDRSYSSVIPIVNIPREEVSIRPELLFLLSTLSIPESDVICKDEFLASLSTASENVDVVVLDHNNLLSDLGEKFSSRVVGILDHHVDEGLHKDAEPRVIAPVGSCTTLVVSYYKDYFTSKPDTDEQAKLVSDVARLALAPIVVDTANLTSKATPEDFEAVKLLNGVLADDALSQFTQAVEETSVESKEDEESSTKKSKADPLETYFSALMNAKRSIDGLSLRDILRKDYKEWREDNGRSVGISSSVKSLKWTVEKFGAEKFREGVTKWVEERKLDAFVFMDSYVTEAGQFRRDLFVTVCSEKGDGCVREFVKAAKKEFELEEISGKESIKDLTVDEETGFWFWNQGNLKASRKQVAPLIREYMQK
ncbi:hypothetical protein BZA70DRAFT_288160 [Myxozyma melibiosi]|uniref:DHHA2 domain-containing protein n=1 Tax=Myxozyma melibiosi TaxID=54550 RepID=A0ABR1FA17_9ASCO